MTTAEYAVHRGISDSYVRRLKREDRLVLSGDGKRIDVAASDAKLDATGDPLRGGDRTGKHAGAGDEPTDPQGTMPVSATGDISLREAMRRERLARARLAELELGETAKQLARVKEMERVMFTLARQALERIRGISSRLRDQLAAESSPRGCEAILDAEIAQVCADLQGKARAIAAAPGADEAADA